MYVPIVNSSVPAGTACVKSIFDANNYLLVYATGVVKNDQTCYLVMVNKLSGKTHCYSSSAVLNLADDYDYGNSYSENLTTVKEYFSVSRSRSGRHLAVMLRSRFTGGGGASYYLVIFNVDNSNELNFKIAFDGSAFFPRPEFSSSTPTFWNFAVTDAGGAYLNFYRNVAGDPMRQSHLYTTQEVSVTRTVGGVVSKLRTEYRSIYSERKSDGSSSADSGVTYFVDASGAAPSLVIMNQFMNPQCWLQSPQGPNVFYSVMKDGNNGNYSLLRLNGVEPVKIVGEDSSICLNYNSSAFVDGNGNIAYYKLIADPLKYSGKVHAKILSLSLAGSTQEQELFEIAPPVAVSCGSSPPLSGDLFEATIHPDLDNRIVVAARTEPTFDPSNGLITSGGLSAIRIYSPIAGTVEDRVTHGDCKRVRRFAQSLARNFGYVIEDFTVSDPGSLVQTTKTFNSRFLEVGSVSKTGQNFKLGFALVLP